MCIPRDTTFSNRIRNRLCTRPRSRSLTLVPLLAIALCSSFSDGCARNIVASQPPRKAPPIPQFQSTPPQATDAAALKPITVAPGQVPPAPDLSGLGVPAPVKGQKGIAVWEPVATGADARTAAFAAGCGRWLHFAVAGQAELGATPAWMTPERFLDGLQRKDLRLSAAQARDLSLIHI